MLTAAILGPVDLRRDGVRLNLPGGKTTELVVRLALDAGAVVRTERLIDDLWSGQAAGVAPNTLQAKVSKLRRVLGDPGLVPGGGGGYALAVDPSRVDALEVLRLADSASALRGAGDVEAAARVCARALAMFAGDLLPGGGDGEWLAPHRTRLEEVRLQLTEDQVATRIALGGAGQVIGELETLVAAHPLREGMWCLLITALYQTGRQAEALGAYRRVQRLLDEELGLDPGPELRRLEQQVLHQDEELSLPTRRPQVSGGGLRPGPSMPGAGPPVGRDADLRTVRQLLDDHRLVTLVGPAGVGKTRLATEVMRRFPSADGDIESGPWLVLLESARSAAAVWESVGAAFHLDAATDSTVLDRLRGSALLLVLDNCEHLVAALPPLVDRMLQAAPKVRVLATSQVPLGMAAEVTHPVDPLTVADSVELFTQRAAAQRRSFQVDADTASVVETVCRSLDGLPLAIELAAARVKVLSVQEIARRLGDRFTLLSDPTSQRPPRQRALREALAWSYDLLFPDDQRGLWALACFAGGAPLAAVEDVLASLGVPATATIDVVGRLADRCLVGVEIGVGGAVRYRLLDSVRAYSLDRLAAAELGEVARRAHAGWFAVAADRAARGVRGKEQPEHLAVVRGERANIDQALAWTRQHDPGLGLRIANGFGWAWIMIGAGVAGAERIRTAVQAAEAVAPAEDLARGLLFAGWLEASGGNVQRAVVDVERAMSLAVEEQRGMALLHRAFVHSVQGQPDEALALLADCRADFHRRGLDWEEGASWVLTAWAEMARGEVARGRAACVDALALVGPLGDAWGLSHAEAILGGLAQAEHRYADAIAHLEHAAEAAHRLGFGATAAHHLVNLGRAHDQDGDPQRARATLQRAIDTAEASADRRTAALARARLAQVSRSLGERGQARALAQSAHRWYLAAGGGEGAGLAEYLLAALDAEQGVPQAAERLAALATRLPQEGPEIQLLALETLARIHAERGQFARARALLDRTAGQEPAVAHLLSTPDRKDRDRARALIAGAAVPTGTTSERA